MTACSNSQSEPVATTATTTRPQGQQFRVVALDLDGTLLTSQHYLSETTIQGLHKLHNQGVVLVFATGRAISTVYEHIVALGLPTALPVVCSNGAAGYSCRVDPTVTPHGVDAQPLFLTTVPRNVAMATMELALAQNHVSQYYVQNQIYAHPSTKTQYQLTEEYKRLTGSQTNYVQPTVFVEEMLNLGLPTKQLVLFPASEQDTVMTLFEQTLQKPDLLVDGQAATLIRGSLGWFLEVLHPQVHKGAGLQRLCREHLHVPLEHVVAFGDGDNDLEFLQMAGHGIVMKNGRRVVKEIANQITKYTNDQDGVVRSLEEMDQQGLLLKTVE